MKRFAVMCGMLLLLAASGVFAQNATIKQMTGNVQLLAPGGSWVNATVGATVSPLTLVATGFNSSAVLDTGTSNIQVKQLTRMRLIELLRNNTSATTHVYLTVGAVHANVANNLGITQKFSIQSPVSTAAVRGTIFDFNGYTLTVDRGIVHFTSPEGLGRNVVVGQSSDINGPYVPGSAEAFEQARSQTPTNTNPTGTGGVPKPPGASLVGTVTVTIK